MNVERMSELLWWITEHPERHRQEHWLDYNEEEEGPFSTPEEAVKRSRWECGTTACLAGWGALRYGWSPTARRVQRLDVADAAVGYELDLLYVEKGNERLPVWIAAAQELELDRSQRGRLFSADMSLYELWRYAAQWSDNQIQIPEHLFEQDPESNDPEDRVLASTLQREGSAG